MNLLHPHLSRPVSPPPVAGSVVRAGVQHAIDRAYRELVEEVPRQDLLRTLCQGLADALELPLVVLLRRHEGGTLEVEAASRENLLWAEFMRLPERWDGTIAGNGPAARALRGREPVSIAANDEGFMPWREAARRDGIARLSAWPLATADADWVLLCASDRTQTDAASGEMAPAAAGFAHLIEAMQRQARERLLAAAVRRAGNAAFIADTDGSIVWCNAAFCSLTGYPTEEVIGRNPRFLGSGRHGQRYYRELWNSIRTGQIWRGETVDRDREGAAFTAIQTISPFGVGDRVTHYLAVYDDISRQKSEQARRELRTGQDPLTGLMHRAALEYVLSEQLAQNKPLRIALVGARRMASITALGEEAMDAFFAEMQSRVRAIAGAEHAARIAGGEFLVQLPDDADQAERVTAALRSELVEPYPMIGEVTAADLRVGCAQAPRDGVTLDALLRRADRALGSEPLTPARRRIEPDAD